MALPLHPHDSTPARCVCVRVCARACMCEHYTRYDPRLGGHTIIHHCVCVCVCVCARARA